MSEERTYVYHEKDTKVLIIHTNQHLDRLLATKTLFTNVFILPTANLTEDELKRVRLRWTGSYVQIKDVLNWKF